MKKYSISKTLYHLLHKYPYESITVSKNIKESHTSRSTFYRYFNDKKDVFTDMYYQFIDPIFYNNKTSQSYYEICKNSINYSNQNKQFFLNMLEDENNTLVKLLYNRNIQYFSKWTTHMTLEQKNLLYIYLRGTFLTSMIWFKEGIFKSSNEMLYLFKKAMPESLIHIFNENRKTDK